LENNLEPSSTKRSADQLVPIAKPLVPPNLKVRKEALDGFVEGNCMLGKFVAFEIILKV